MIIAVPLQRTEVFSGIGIPQHTAVVTWYRWWCTSCRVPSGPANAWSHASYALQMGEHHEQRAQCQTLGQLSLFALPAGAR